jgi:hypothetical protein
VGGATYTATATATSGLPVTITSATTSVCTGSGTNGSAVITFVGSGTCTLNANQGGNANYNAATQVQQSFSVTSPAATHFSVSAGATQTAGTSFTVTITAQDASNNTVPSYTGNHSITLTSTAGTAPDGTAPTLPSGNVNFSAGVGTVTVTLVKAESGRTITANDGTINGTSNSITVVAGTAVNLAWENVSSSAGTVSSPCLFTCNVAAMGNNQTFTANVGVTDAHGNLVSNLGAGHTVTVSTDGGAFTAPTAGSSVTLTVSSTGSALTTQTFTFKTQTGLWTVDHLTASSTGYTNASAALNKN